MTDAACLIPAGFARARRRATLRGCRTRPSRTGGRAALAACAVLAAVLLATAAPANAALPVVYSLPAATAYAAAHPDTSPAGANEWSCRPAKAHPRPVVLVHGSLENMAFNWFTLSPLLKNAGYCVYALNYGQERGRYAGFPGARHPGGTAPIERSSAELAQFVQRVLAASGAAKVDIVGFSQGGMLPRHYLRFGGGAAKVRTLVGLSPSNHGTLSSLDALPAAGALVELGLGAALRQQVAGSQFMGALNSAGDTVAGVRYTVIQTRYDEVVTPYTSAFLSGPRVTNILLQDRFPLDLSDHLGMSYDPAVLRYVLDALAPGHARRTTAHRSRRSRARP
jgi:triacylglycerol esterase/lipase EstA (alpha/beta hydrolase family)